MKSMPRIFRNPFPQQASVSIESDRDPSAAQRALIAASLVLQPISILQSRVMRYVEQKGEQREGLAIALRGPHGSGKTHAVRHVLREVTPDRSLTKVIVVLSVQLNGPDPLAALRQLLGGFTLDVVHRIRLGHRAAVARDQLGQSKNPTELEYVGAETLQEINRDASLALQQDPSAVLGLEAHYIVDRESVDEVLGRELARVPRRQADFRSAFQYLDGGTLGEVALRWLQGAALSDDERRSIGVASSLSDQEELGASLVVLASLCTRARVPVIVFVDQFEKLVFDARNEPMPEQKALRMVAFEIPQAGGLVIFAGSVPAWDALPQDLQQRFFPQIVLAALTVDEATELVDKYVACAADGPVRANMVFPPEAMREIVRYGSGNPRRMLQLCYSAYEATPKDVDDPILPISAETVVVVAENEQGLRLDPPSVRLEIERIIFKSGQSFVRNPVIGKRKADFAVPAKSPRVIIEVKEALFHPDEAQHGLEALGLIEEARAAGLTAAVVLVVIGYASREVAKVLERVVHEYLVYEPITFEAQFTALLQRIAPGGEPAEPRPDAHRKEPSPGQVWQARSELQYVAERRDSDARSLERRLADLRARDAGPELLAWRKIKVDLQKDIHATRQARRKAEMDEFVGAVDRAWTRRSRWIRTTAASVGVVVVFAFAVLGFPILIRDTLHLSSPIWDIVFLGAPAAFMWALLSNFPSSSVDFKAFSSARESTEKLERFARALTTVQGSGRGPTRWSRDPLVRYSALLKAPLFIGELGDELAIETCTLIRRLVLRTFTTRTIDLVGPIKNASSDFDQSVIGNRERVFIERLVLGLTEGDWPYFVERMAIESPKDLFEWVLERAPPQMTTLATIYKRVPFPRSPAIIADVVFGDLSDVFDAGVGAADFDLIANIPIRALQTAVAELSPLEDGGLGTYDNLERRREIEEYYLFFRQLLFLREGGNVAPQPPEATTGVDTAAS